MPKINHKDKPIVSFNVLFSIHKIVTDKDICLWLRLVYIAGDRSTHSKDYLCIGHIPDILLTKCCLFVQW